MPDSMSPEVNAKRLQAVRHYGGACDRCGEDNEDFLRIDGPSAAMDQLGRAIYSSLTAGAFPEGFHVICGNCYVAAQNGVTPKGLGIRAKQELIIAEIVAQFRGTWLGSMGDDRKRDMAIRMAPMFDVVEPEDGEPYVTTRGNTTVSQLVRDYVQPRMC